MELYLVIVIILFILAISDLIVGVSNDAVNFLNSAIGSNVAPRYVIMIVASIGILVGTTFSSGLMEVARKGIFNPQFFYLNEIMVIFLAVMITDVLLLDLYNTFALPTSTTVSIVFELLGAAVAVSLIKIGNSGEGFGDLVKYINTSKAFAIISGILLSVVIAFTVGAIIQFITRMIFTFDYKVRLKRYGAIWGGIALSAITFFILIKGAKGSSFLTSDNQEWIKTHSNTILLISFFVWTIILQLVQWFTKVNILKPIVLVGTFALALAFAANDLVNFIGVPLAGLSTYKIGLSSSDPFGIYMEALTQKVSTPTILLLIAGGIMVVTLWLNKKSRSVTKTEVNLGRQSEGFERFESTLLSRSIVGMSVGLNNLYKIVVPSPIQNSISNRFKNVNSQLNLFSNNKGPAFDLIRASVNLMVASMLISFATSLKLPLSTTYVTFMVAMGTSLSDKAWGRDSAVFRVTGVITVIGGWFLTAIIAFTISGTFAVIIYYGELPAIILLTVLAAFFIYKTHVLHKNKTIEEEKLQYGQIEGKTTEIDSIKTFVNHLSPYLESIGNAYRNSLESFNQGSIVGLKENNQQIKLIKKNANFLVAEVLSVVKKFPEEKNKTRRRLGKMIANIQQLYIHTKDINQKCLTHIANNHTLPIGDQVKELEIIREQLNSTLNSVITILEEGTFENIEEYQNQKEKFAEDISTFDENQLYRISQGKDTTRNSMLFIELLSESESIANHTSSLVTLLKKNYDKYKINDAE